MARAPSAVGKSRLAAHFSPPRLHALKLALLADTLRALETLPDVFIFFTPNDAEREFARLGDLALQRVTQGDGDLGARMLAAMRHLLEALKYEAAVLVGSDIPWLSADHVREAFATLQATGGVVLGPADDGGYYLIGMTRAVDGLFEDIAWGTGSVLTDTLRAAERLAVDARLIRSAYDVDTIADVQRFERDLALAPAHACPNLRRWLGEISST
jgi:rSAM/selenodomain-associated transferase 1